MFTTLVLVLSLAAAAPYEDTRGRFTLDLPSGWALAPHFGDTEGMRFERALPARLGSGLAAVRVVAAPGEDLSAWMERESGDRRRNGWRVRRKEARVGGRDAVRLTATKDGQLVRVDGLSVGEYSYRIHLELQRRDLRWVARDVKAILRSFRPADPARPAAAARPPPAAPASRPTARAVPSRLVGQYEGDAGIALRLTSDGTFRLGKLEGTFEVRDDRLTLVSAGGRRTEFEFKLSEAGALSLSSSALAKPAVYVRVRPGGRVAGRWTLPAPSGSVILELKLDGQFSLGDQKGQWVVEDGRLKLRRSDTEVATYDYRVFRGRLFLSGGDLDDELELTPAR